MKLGIKIATLLFFISGIVFFVGYQSGYFFPVEKPIVHKSSEPEMESLVEADVMEVDTVKIDTSDAVTVESAARIAASPRRNEFKTSISKQESKSKHELLKLEELKQSNKSKLRISSSKSVIFDPFPDDEPFRMSSSKSARTVRPFIEVFKPRFFESENALENKIKVDSMHQTSPYNENFLRKLKEQQDSLK